ncbi:MAG: 3-hydroxyacyl-CoA dehydrogenase family protein [Pseudomonadota bacterium]
MAWSNVPMADGAMSADALRHCAVLGAGTMGAQIALSLALGGCPVTLWARRAESLPDAADRMRQAYRFLAAEGLAVPQREREILGRIVYEPVLAKTVARAGFVIEAIAEVLEVKHALLTAAEALAPAEAILASTTSALSATDLQTPLARPDLFCVAHYAQPAHLVALVEVVPGNQTADATTDAVIALLETTGKTPVVCPDIPGFLWARIQHAVLREFASLVGRGLATPEACDMILKKGYAARLPAMGSFEHADLAGLDLMNGDAAKAVWADLSNVTDPGETPVGALFAQGHTGMRSGRGFYDWTERDPEAFKRQRDAEIVRRVLIQAGGKVHPPHKT